MHRAAALALLTAFALGCGSRGGGPLRAWVDEPSGQRDPSRGASFPAVVAAIAREGSSRGFELRAIPITPAYLWAFHLRRANADLVPVARARARLRHDLARFTTRHTSFVVTLRFGGNTPLGPGEPMLDLRAWRFRLIDARGVVREPATVLPYEAARETDSERAGLLAAGDRLVFEHVVRGVVRFRLRLRAHARRIVLEATPPMPAPPSVRVDWWVAD
ncbi:MAG: hypothetical protein IT379_12855 [Deltaproteobacteria bacterium]|nr:hypothetical protein [Deltaproteobacteria bacterium]